MRAELIPNNGGPPIAITRDITVVGRREYCDIQLDDPSLSKRHCVLIKTDGLLMIRDLATTNGTRVKGQIIRWAALLPNDQISIGKLKFRVFLGPDGSSSSPPGVKKSKSRVRSKSRPPSRSLSTQASPPAPRAVATGAARPTPAEPARPALDLDDSRWFERVGSDRNSEEIIDLD